MEYGYLPELADEPDPSKLDGKPPAPEVYVDSELGYCSVDSSLEGKSLSASPATVYVIATVPSVWTMGSAIAVRWDLWNDGETYASGKLYFYGKEGVDIEAYGERTYSIRPFRSTTLYLQVSIEPGYSVGIKSAITRATQAGVPGDIYYNDHGYSFVQRFGEPSTPPPSDAMSSASNNPTYYYEGLANDGFNVPSEAALFHCKDWVIIWDAALQVDGAPGTCTNPFATGSILVPQVHWLIDYPQPDDPDLLECQATGLSDYEIISRGYRGVCDEHAFLMISYLRALGVPARYICGSEVLGGGHGWCELWSGSRWIHADPTNNWYNVPQVYQSAGNTYTDAIHVCAKWNDTKVFNEPWKLENGTKVYFDQGNDNGIFGYGDVTYDTRYGASVLYENYYGRSGWRDPCSSTAGWIKQTAGTMFQLYRAIDETGVLRTSSGYLYCTDIAPDSSIWKHGPLYIKNLGFSFKLKELEYLRIDMELVNSIAMGDLVVILYDEDGNIVTVCNLYDSQYGSTSQAYFRYHNATQYPYQWFEGTHSGSWRGIWKIWRGILPEDRSMKASLDDGTPTQSTVYGSLEGEDLDVKIAYIGIQFARAYSYTYHGQGLRLHDLELKFYFGSPAV